MRKNKQIILYGVSLALLLLLLKYLEYHFLLVDRALETYVGIIALLFMALGIWLARKLAKPSLQTIIVEKEVLSPASPSFTIHPAAANRLNLSKRELDVLQLMAEGLSNQEISDRLFVSTNTIKTHSSRLFEKMEVKRRTQAVEMAKRLGIIV